MPIQVCGASDSCCRTIDSKPLKKLMEVFAKIASSQSCENVARLKIVRQPLPAMNRMIEQLQKDLQIPVQTPGAFPDFRAWEADRRASPGRH